MKKLVAIIAVCLLPFQAMADESKSKPLVTEVSQNNQGGGLFENDNWVIPALILVIAIAAASNSSDHSPAACQ